MSQINAKARVQILVEVEAGTWGEECSIGQLNKQAAESGINAIQTMAREAKQPLRIIGELKVIGVITERP